MRTVVWMPAETTRNKLRPADALWLLAYPLYQVIGTFRHENSHALVAASQGATIDRLVILPSLQEGNWVLGLGHVAR